MNFWKKIDVLLVVAILLHVVLNMYVHSCNRNYNHIFLLVISVALIIGSVKGPIY